MKRKRWRKFRNRWSFFPQIFFCVTQFKILFLFYLHVALCLFVDNTVQQIDRVYFFDFERLPSLNRMRYFCEIYFKIWECNNLSKTVSFVEIFQQIPRKISLDIKKVVKICHFSRFLLEHINKWDNLGKVIKFLKFWFTLISYSVQTRDPPKVKKSKIMVTRKPNLQGPKNYTTFHLSSNPIKPT